MSEQRTFVRTGLAGIALAGATVLLLAGCERPPVTAIQHGYRGIGMEVLYNPRTVEENLPRHAVPDILPPAPADGPKAREVFQNVKVLGDLSIAEFTRTMASISNWVAPAEQCVYCHDLNNLADDSKYTKQVARQMLLMTREVNTNWKPHVAQTGVTCYTCHRGNAVPPMVWTKEVPQDLRANFIGDRGGQNLATAVANQSSLPSDPFTPYLLGNAQARVIGQTPLPTGNMQSIKQTEFTYSLMMHMSQALGVGCTYCHNSRSFAEWDGPNQRVTAWYGLQMVRSLNNKYVAPLATLLPADRLGPAGDSPKANCQTCHQGAYKPLFGAQMAKEYPALWGAATVVAEAAPAAPAASAGPVAAAAEGLIGKVLFDTAKTDLTADARKTIASAVDVLKKNPAAKVDLSGFADKRGAVDKNLELAKQRAFAVRDALVTAGVGKDRINLKKPEFAVAGGAESEARRVDITVVK